MIINKTYVFCKVADHVMELYEMEVFPLEDKILYSIPQYYRWLKEEPYLEFWPHINPKAPIEIFTAQKFHDKRDDKIL